MQDFEKLGAFYLGKIYDPQKRSESEELLLYDSKDLTTHAAVIGMTGSGKTGLCIGLIEEAAIDGIPAILIDPKGDLANLALTFPDLYPEDFLPWVNPDVARQKGLSLEEYAAKQAALWRKGIARYGQDRDRIRRLRDAAEVLIFTPGSSAGIPVSILDSLNAPPPALLEDADLLRERILTTVSSLLGLLGLPADPVKSREHVLLSNILSHTWKNGQSLDLTTLIQQVQDPPFAKIGVLDIETFYPASDRFSLMMALNNLLGSPGFSAWMEGVPLDLDEILYTSTGKPRIAIFSIAHLRESERMFFVSLLLNQVLSWMRAQPGTTSLRALLYMDEIYGYLPPSKNPPSKQPLLTLLKQGRAFGLGVLLATQNPVDLDYKALSNMGSWFIGRLQTERDRARLLDGLESLHAEAGMSRRDLERLIASLDSRVFLLNNTHEDGPVVFHTRWVLSYLPGPLTRDQIKRLMDPVREAILARRIQPLNAAPTAAPAAAAAPEPRAQSAPPPLPAGLEQYFLPVRGMPKAGQRLEYRPYLFGAARVAFIKEKYGINESRTLHHLTPITNGPIPVQWANGQESLLAAQSLENEPAAQATFAPLPAAAAQKKSYTAWKKDYKNWLYASQTLKIYYSPQLKVYSHPGENERAFRIRLAQIARERRDEAAEKLRKKYAPRLARLQERLRKAEQRLEKEQAQASKAKLDAAVSFGTALLSAFTGRKAFSSTTLSKASSAMKGVTRSMEQSQDIEQAEETVAAIQQQLADLEAEFEQEVAALETRFDPMSESLRTMLVKPRKSDISVQLVTLVWAPFFIDAAGTTQAAW